MRQNTVRREACDDHMLLVWLYFVIHWRSYGPASYVEMSGPETGGGVPLGEVSFALAHLSDFVSFYLSFFIYDYLLYLINQVNTKQLLF